MRFNNKNVILPEPWVPGVPNDEIWYTSSDGAVVTPRTASSLPTIVSNTYSDGKGVIKFASDVTSIGASAFQGRRKLTSVTIPDSVTGILRSAFEDCTGLTSVTIGNSVLAILDHAFYNCKHLTSISFTGTIAQWNDIGKGPGWNYNVPVVEVHCSDGDARI